MSSETRLKLRRLRAFLKRHRLHGAVLCSRANFAWLTGGGDNHCVSQSERGVAFLVVTARSAWCVTSRIEQQRMVDEEPLGDFRPVVFPWAEALSTQLDRMRRGQRWASDDAALTGLPALPDTFSAECRSPLLDEEIARYRALGRACSEVMERVARSLHRGARERAVEAELAGQLLKNGIQPHVLLVGFDNRIHAYRHPVPTDRALRRHAMIVICGQRHGLIANLTRLVHLGPLPTEIRRRHLAVCRVEAALWEATVAGARWSAALDAGLQAYAREGFPGEWLLHHQGGPTGYAGREFTVTPDEQRMIEDRQAVAWNPSITGTKSEDTFILDGKRRIVVTACSRDWPQIEVRTPGHARLSRPDVLELS